MKKFWYVLLMMCCVIALPSCDDDEDISETYKEWREENEAFILNIKNSGEYSELDVPSKMGKIYVKVLQDGEGTEPIYYTSTVKVHYKGTFINGTVFESYMSPYQSPATFVVNSKIDGFSAALQYMKAGDKWDVWIPWDIAYGSSGATDSNNNYTILPYSTLNFEIEIVEIVEQ